MQAAFLGKNRWLYHLATFAILAGFALTIISWMQLCTVECNDAHNYHLFGLPFETIGLGFFSILLLSHLYSRTSSLICFLSILLVAAGLGSELFFIFVQKFKIGHWCPICLAIASCVTVAATCYTITYIQDFHQSLNNTHKGEYMKSSWRGVASLTAFILGFLLAFVGISKTTPLQAAQTTIKNQLWLGDPNSKIEVYIFTDWACPACRKAEPSLEKMAPQIAQKARLLFVDTVIHPATLNYSPYNLSFLVNNKADYIKIRHALTQLSEETGEPTEEAIAVLTKSLGIKYKELNFAEVSLAQKYYKDLSNQFDIDGTPTIVIVNPSAKKGKKLAGISEITAENVFENIEKLK